MHFSFFHGTRDWSDLLQIKGLTPSRTASGHTAPVQIEQHPNVAAMRWREWLATHFPDLAELEVSLGRTSNANCER